VRGGFALAIATIAVAASAVPTSAATVNGSAGTLLRTYAPRAQTTAVSSTVLGGLSSQGWPVVFLVSGNEKRLSASVIALRMACASGVTLIVRDAVFNLPIRANGRVSTSREIQPSTGSAASLTGSRSFVARLNRKRLTISGTWHLHLDFQFSGGQTDHCDSGNVGVSARV
jgi:hypothetical protein